MDVVFLLQKNIKSPLKSESERVDMDVKHPGFVADFRSEGNFLRKNALEKRESRKTKLFFQKNLKSLGSTYLFSTHTVLAYPYGISRKKNFALGRFFCFLT